jgi:hypothetical protein
MVLMPVDRLLEWCLRQRRGRARGSGMLEGILNPAKALTSPA